MHSASGSGRSPDRPVELDASSLGGARSRARLRSQTASSGSQLKPSALPGIFSRAVLLRFKIDLRRVTVFAFDDGRGMAEIGEDEKRRPATEFQHLTVKMERSTALSGKTLLPAGALLCVRPRILGAVISNTFLLVLARMGGWTTRCRFGPVIHVCSKSGIRRARCR